MPKYRVQSSHCGDPYEHHETIELPDDKAALDRLTEIASKKESAWDDFSMVRIDVEEKTTQIGFANGNNGNPRIIPKVKIEELVAAQ